MGDAPPSKYKGLPFTGKRNEPREVAKPLGSAIAPLMRQFRKYETYHACLAVLDELFEGDLEGLAAPFDLRLVPSADSAPGQQQADVHALFIMAANQTVASVLQQKSRVIVERINTRLRVPTVEELRCEQTPLLKVQKQLEVLRLEPA
ncbi:hypothetical protein IT575_02500 [bacterium]|nr:hypothetical protein [bacterium]